MKIRVLLCVMLLGMTLSVPVYANTNRIISQQTQRRDAIMARYRGQFDRLKVTANQKAHTHRSIVSPIKNTQQPLGQDAHQTLIRQSPPAVIFASFSMPHETFRLTLQEAARFHIPVVLRGLYKNSFKETAAKIFEWVKKNRHGGVLIDPVWFRQYHIKTVPALVVQKNDGSGTFDVIYGNIPIKQGLEVIAEQGEAAATAKALLGEKRDA